MSPPPNSPHSVRRVVLPSGKTIEIVYFPVSDNGVGAPVEDLNVCGSCHSDLVYPIDWEEAGDSGWELVLRCPNCDWVREGVFGHPAVDRLDEQLDAGTQALVHDLRDLAHANMEDEVERFIEALQTDQVLPMDF
jgi:hypothetical protein